MGRPGYVLVARQMGKTNLLLNAKRELETDEDVFVYVDLSNSFESMKECFENIIDIACETNMDKFQDAYSSILKFRVENKEMSPHKLHGIELRNLLKCTKGKIVIILDEIDALTKTAYSDQVFAQIRSVYFSRVNYPELNNLTYLLSGVVEPTEIIKNPKISPFNIGQKIFLNDFNKAEFFEFLDKAGLKVESKIADRIFYWTNGSPRMTWDICSELESIETASPIDEYIIDNLVHEGYLKSFDRPPVDNIRELVKNDREIRLAIGEIYKGNVAGVTDKVKNKLYLAGVINYYEDSVEIKNEIIRKSISPEWLKSVDKLERGVLKLALDAFGDEEFSDSLAYFEEFLSKDDFSYEMKDTYYYYMGFSAYNLGRLEVAKRYLSEANFDIDASAGLYQRRLHLLGICCYYIKDVSGAIAALEEIYSVGIKNDVYFRAVLDLACIKSFDNDSDEIKRAESLIDEILEDDLSKYKIKPSVIKEIISVANFRKANVLQYFDKPRAREYYHSSLISAPDTFKPSILLGLYELSEDSEKAEALRCVVGNIEENSLLPINSDLQNFQIEYNLYHIHKILLETFRICGEYYFEETLNKFSSKEGFVDKFRFLMGASMLAFGHSDDKYGIEILTYLINYPEYGDMDSASQIPVIRFLISFGAELKQDKIDAYWEYLDNNNTTTIDSYDFEAVLRIAVECLEKDQLDTVLDVIRRFRSYASKVDERTAVNYLLFDHLELNVHKIKGDERLVKLKAATILSKVESATASGNVVGLMKYANLSVIKSNALNALQSLHKPIPIRVVREYGRNEIVRVRYNDGKVVEAKFKRLKDDLERDLCVIVE